MAMFALSVGELACRLFVCHFYAWERVKRFT